MAQELTDTIDIFDQKLGARLRQVRAVHGMTQQEVAEVIGVSFQQVQKYEKGINRLAVRSLYILSKHLNISLATILEDLWDEEDKDDNDNGEMDNVRKRRRQMMRAFDRLNRHQFQLIVQIIAEFIGNSDGGTGGEGGDCGSMEDDGRAGGSSPLFVYGDMNIFSLPLPSMYMS